MKKVEVKRWNVNYLRLDMGSYFLIDLSAYSTFYIRRL